MKFLYLTQTADTIPYQGQLENLVCLTYKKEVPGAVYFPNSTWTTGRNKLLEIIKQKAAKGEIYDYYIFVDDDTYWVQGSWKAFEDRLAKEEPQIGMPYLQHYTVNYSGKTVFMYDACINAFSKHVIFDTDLLPYDGHLDALSWWYSQYVVIYRTIYMFHPKDVHLYEDLIYDDVAHTPYPRRHDDNDFLPYFEEKYQISRRYAKLPYRISSTHYKAVGNAIQVPVKSDFLVSLGNACLMTHILEENGLRKFVGPFDSTFNTVGTVTHCLSDNFETFLNQGLHSDASNHQVYGPNYFDGRDVRKPEDYAGIVQSVQRFQAVLNNPGVNVYTLLTFPQSSFTGVKDVFPTWKTDYDASMVQALYDKLDTQPGSNVLVVINLIPGHPEKLKQFAPNPKLIVLNFFYPELTVHDVTLSSDYRKKIAHALRERFDFSSLNSL
jgi:hypothetical protein